MLLRPVLSALALVGLAAAGCAEAPAQEVIPDDPNDGLLRDFIDGKFDDAGHPLNAKIVEGSRLGCGTRRGEVYQLSGTCDVSMPTGAEVGGLTVSARLRVRQHGADGGIYVTGAVIELGRGLINL